MAYIETTKKKNISNFYFAFFSVDNNYIINIYIYRNNNNNQSNKNRSQQIDFSLHFNNNNNNNKKESKLSGIQHTFTFSIAIRMGHRFFSSLYFPVLQALLLLFLVTKVINKFDARLHAS